MGGQDKDDGKLTLLFYYYFFCDYSLALGIYIYFDCFFLISFFFLFSFFLSFLSVIFFSVFYFYRSHRSMINSQCTCHSKINYIYIYNGNPRQNPAQNKSPKKNEKMPNKVTNHAPPNPTRQPQTLHLYHDSTQQTTYNTYPTRKPNPHHSLAH